MHVAYIVHLSKSDVAQKPQYVELQLHAEPEGAKRGFLGSPLR